MNSNNIKKSEFTIGLVMSIATFIVIFGILWLGKSNIFVTGLHINVLVENANGISVGDEVFYSGLKVGTITSTEISPKGILLDAKIERLKKIPIDSKFYITDYSMIGGKVLEIVPGKSDKMLKSGDVVRGTVAPGLTDAITSLTDLSPKIDELLDNLNALTGKGNQTNVKATFAELQQLIKDFKKLVNGKLSNTVSNLNDFTKANTNKLSVLIDSLNRNSKELSKFLKSSSTAAKSLDSLLSRINSGKGSLGKLAKDEALYNNLNSSVITLDSLITDIKKNPQKYFKVKVF